MVDSDFWVNRKVLLTGHTGFKGSWLCMLLNSIGVNLYGFSLKKPVSDPSLFTILNLDSKMTDFRGDITNPAICNEIFDKIAPEILIHMAAQPLVRESYHRPIDTLNTNVMGTANILESARSCNTLKTILVITSDKCYENIEQNYAYKEEDQLGGFDPYSSSKACAEHISSAYYKSYFEKKDISLATARAGNVIGGGDWSKDRLIPDIIRSWVNENEVILRSPYSIRPWQHVIDALFGYMVLIQNQWKYPEKFFGGWNFGPDKNSLKKVIDVLKSSQSSWGRFSDFKIEIDKTLHEANLLMLDNKKAKSKLGIDQKISFDKAIEYTILWYENYYFKKKDMFHFTLNQIKESLSI